MLGCFSIWIPLLTLTKIFLVFMLILLFIQTIDHFPEIPDGRFFFDVAIIAPGPDGLKMYACHRTHHRRLKRTGAGAIIARRTITITARKGTSGTATATVKIMIMYGCLIPLGSLKRTPPRTEPWVGWGRRLKKNIGGVQRSTVQQKFGAEEQGVGDGRSFQLWPWSDF